MHESVRKIIKIVRVPSMSESAETISIKINSKWLITYNQNVNSQIKLFAANQQWVAHISLDNVWFSLRTLWLPSQLIFPLGDLLELVEEEDASALTLADGLHDPKPPLTLKLIHKHGIFSRKIKCERTEVVLRRLLVLPVFFELPFLPLDVFD